MGAMLTKAGRNVQPPPCSRGMPDCFEPLSQCPLDVAQPRSGGGQQFGPAFDEIRTSQRRNTEVRLTHRWREMDSNIRFRAEETAIFEPPRIERASFSPCTSRRRHRPAPRAAILRRAPKIRTRRRMRGRHSAPIIPDGCPTTPERLGNGASRAMLLMTAGFEEPRTKGGGSHGINWGHSGAGAAQKTGASAQAQFSVTWHAGKPRSRVITPLLRGVSRARGCPDEPDLSSYSAPTPLPLSTARMSEE